MTLKTFLRLAILVAIVVAVTVIGYSATDSSSEDPDDAAPATTAEPISTLPTSETVKLAIFERAYSECASTELADLAGKYKIAETTEETVATGVARGWVKFFDAGEDAIPEGRSGCLMAFKEEK